MKKKTVIVIIMFLIGLYWLTNLNSYSHQDTVEKDSFLNDAVSEWEGELKTWKTNKDIVLVLTMTVIA